MNLLGAKFLGEIRQFQAEPGVGLVRAKAVEGLLESQAREGRRNVNVQGQFPEALEQSFDERVNVLALDEAHLQVQLGEFQLAVGALVFVAEAAGDLVIAFQAGDHEHLFELLRRLGQGVKSARLAAVGHEEFARAFGGGFEKNGRLDFDKALLVHEQAGGGGDFAAQADVAEPFRGGANPGSDIGGGVPR